MLTRRLLAFATILALATACGGGSDDGGDGEHQEAYALNAAICGRLDDCCRAAGRPNDPSICAGIRGYAIQRVDAAKAAVCKQELPSSACSAELPRACLQATAGAGKPGDACENSLDCAFPDEALDAGCMSIGGKGICFVKLPPVEGAPCKPFEPEASGPWCAWSLGYTCVPSSLGSGQGTCQKIPGPGEVCVEGESCHGGFFCQDGVCPALPKIGDPCTLDCGDELRCTSAKVCAKLLAGGAACDLNTDCESKRCDSATKTCGDEDADALFCTLGR